MNVYTVEKYVNVFSKILNLINNTFVSAFTHGDPSTLLSPTDSQGRRCGLDAEVRDKPYLFFFDLTKCAAPNAIATGCRTPQVCLHLCFNW